MVGKRAPGAAQAGCLVIADITGYTAFLNESELEHAEGSLRALLQVIVNRTKMPFVVSQLEGDAVFSYALAGSVQRGQTLVEAVEGTYIDFARTLERMTLNTTCTCNACKNIPNLNLKFIVHHSNFVVSTVGDRAELIGSDVNLLHRLLKNTVVERTGFAAYAAYTQGAVDALGLGEFAASLVPDTERHEHLGDVRLFVQDMTAAWQPHRAATRLGVTPEKAMLTYHADFPLPPAIMWDYAASPQYRSIISGSRSQHIVGQRGGRTRPGTVYECVHTGFQSRHTIVEWRPFEEVTVHGTFPLPGVTALLTTMLEPRGDGTALTVRVARCEGPWLLRTVGDVMMRMPPTVGDGLKKLRQRLDAELAEKGPAVAAPPEPSADEIKRQARAALLMRDGA